MVMLMIKISMAKKGFFKFNEKCNICFEGKGNYVLLDLDYSRSLQPYPGGILKLDDMIKLRDLLDNEIQSTMDLD